MSRIPASERVNAGHPRRYPRCMPPVTRRPDPAKVRTALAEEWHAIIDYAAALTDEQRAQPSALAGWSVQDLVNHIAQTAGVVVIRAARPAEKAEGDVVFWTTQTALAAQWVDEEVKEAAESGIDLAR